MPDRGKVIEDVSGIWKISSNHQSQEPVAQKQKDAENQCIYTDEAAVSNRQGQSKV